MHTVSPKPLGFDIYTLDLQRCSLLRAGDEVQLRPKSFDVLRYLAEHAGRLVSKEELIQAIWPDLFVTEDSVVQCIGDIRAALRDDAHRIIKTIPRRGYLFAAELSDKELEERPPAIGSRGQEITFCRTKDGVNIAVACVGQGMPLVCIPTWLTHLEHDWEGPIRGPLCRFLADRFRLIRYDGRGFGLSDRDVTEISFATFERDLEAVVDALGLRFYALLGISMGAAIAIAHAVRYPERVSKMVIHGGFALGRNQRGSAEQVETARTIIAILREGWGDEHSAFQRMLGTLFFPTASPEQIKWLVNSVHKSTTIDNAVRILEANQDVNVLRLLPKVSAPTLVIHCSHDNVARVDEGRRIAAAIPNARFVILDSENHVPLPVEPAWLKFLGEIEAFLSVQESAKELSKA
jgi:pimeloyl-ACP methyl ester carboxylesterase/DNA-binding winged helix-turn-helix (wHTH) protein